MRKLIIATAALALMSGAASAQSVLDTAKFTLAAATTATATTTAVEPKAEKVEFNYKAFSRDPKKYTDKLVTVTGKVLQVVEEGDDLAMRIATSGSYGDVIYVTYSRKSDDESRVLADDRVTITGTYEGIHSYQSVGAGPMSIPHVDADKIDQAPVVSRRSRR